ncbi:rotamase [Lysobacter pythonis]|uniref:peptidylprolyl isomerase n=1 Tax=Solilutibacter pythonis TaxID=2483112 RepID=A0A3M2HVL9_9GAMM|nr:peptidylprolyl isomerase [Lysobacter pythonis]RMH93776.1 rotamase [Lysobacter pythonis]
MRDRIIPLVMDAGALSDAAARASAQTAEANAHGQTAATAPPGPAPVYVRVAGEPIDEAEIAREMQFHRAADPHAARQAAAATLAIRELVRRECQRLALPVEPLAGETEDEARVRVLIEHAIDAPEADADAIRRYYDANRTHLHHPDRIRARHILLAAPPAQVQARHRAQRLGEELIGALKQAPEHFIELAMRHSACPSRDEGGELGWIERGDTVPEFDRQLFMLKPGLAGLTVETRYGHHVVEVLERIEGAPMRYDEARDRIASYLETQTRQNALHQYLHILAERYGVEGIEIAP